MAELNKSVLGKVRGAIGDITFRQRNGKNFIALRPRSFNPGEDAASILRRNKFVTAAKIAKVINSNPVLNKIWKGYAENGVSAYNQIIKINYPYIGSELLPGAIQLSPAAGFRAVKSNIQIESKTIKLGIAPLGENCGIDTSEELFISLYLLAFLKKPKDESMDYIHLFNGASEATAFTLTDPINITVNMPGNWEHLFSEYNEQKAAFILVTSDAVGNPLRFSSTFI